MGLRKTRVNTLTWSMKDEGKRRLARSVSSRNGYFSADERFSAIRVASTNALSFAAECCHQESQNETNSDSSANVSLACEVYKFGT